MEQEKIRNVAIIAHVDHGKTTLVDAFLKQSKLFRENQQEMQQEQILDSGELEREKGITIKAKDTSVNYNEYRINIIDTPGHADFGGEVERTLNMADGCILLVDAQEGVMPQTKFVLKKALELNLTPIVVINKIDKKLAKPLEMANRVQDLFLQYATHESQLDFPIVYAIGREGKAFTELPTGDLTIPDSIPGDMKPIFDLIVERIPAPDGDRNKPFQMQISEMEYDEHTGRALIGRISRGTVKLNDPVILIHGDEVGAKKEQGRVKKIMVRQGLVHAEVNEAGAGEIVAIAGIDSVAIGSTLCALSAPEALPMIKITPPSVKIKFEANTSPLAGKEGEYVTAKQLQQRLEKESEINISLEISKDDGGSYYVAGRGELQLSILIETLRREGFEFQVRKPEIILREEAGKKVEPMEEVTIDAPDEYMGLITQELSNRSGELVNIQSENGHTQFIYRILTRNLLGLRNVLINASRGNVIINNFLAEYVPYKEMPEIYRKGVIISLDNGVAMGYALNTIQERGDLFIEPGTQVYEGMIIGINKYEQDIEVNPTKARHKSGVRMKQDEITQTILKAVIPLTLEYALVFLGKDELLEVTPKSLRLRKVFLTHNEREWAKRKNLSEFAKQQLGIS